MWVCVYFTHGSNKGEYHVEWNQNACWESMWLGFAFNTYGCSHYVCQVERLHDITVNYISFSKREYWNLEASRAIIHTCVVFPTLSSFICVVVEPVHCCLWLHCEILLFLLLFVWTWLCLHDYDCATIVLPSPAHFPSRSRLVCGGL